MRELTLPGDKSIAHRALVCALLAKGESLLENIPEGEDVAHTRTAVRLLAELPEGADAVIDCGSSGTTLRLLTGFLAARPGSFQLRVSAQLARRPMAHIVRALRSFGVKIALDEQGDTGVRVRITGRPLRGVDVECAFPSAQLKAALILAALQAGGVSHIIEPVPTRDHMERLLPLFGASVEIDRSMITVWPRPLRPAQLRIPGDVSAAAPWIVATLQFGEAPLCIREVGLNPTRLGLITTLQRAGARIETAIETWYGHEPVGSISIWPTPELSPLTVSAMELPTCIDELPLLALAACAARGTSRFEGVELLRTKESDRLQVILEVLMKCSAKMELNSGELLIHGPVRIHYPDSTLPTHDDHRIAMLCAVIILGQRSTRRISLDQPRVIAKSYPGFWREFAAIFPGFGLEAFDNAADRC